MAENTAQYINLHIHEHTYYAYLLDTVKFWHTFLNLHHPSSREIRAKPVQGISTGVLLSLYSMFVNGLTWYILSTPLLLAAFPSTIIDKVSVNAVTDADIYYEHRRCNFHRGRDHPQTDPFINLSIAPQSENK
uniref:Uncharacterized protein n=1 Tax=Glossina palpalis gambiensis TaxID=67801 RepID=A0A1B0B738_9MUSC